MRLRLYFYLFWLWYWICILPWNVYVLLFNVGRNIAENERSLKKGVLEKSGQSTLQIIWNKKRVVCWNVSPYWRRTNTYLGDAARSALLRNVLFHSWPNSWGPSCLHCKVLQDNFASLSSLIFRSFESDDEFGETNPNGCSSDV